MKGNDVDYYSNVNEAKAMMIMGALERVNFGEEHEKINSRYYLLWKEITSLLSADGKKKMLELEKVGVSRSSIEQEFLYKKGFNDCNYLFKNIIFQIK